MTRGISALWASDGTRHCREVAPTVMHLLRKGLEEMTVLTVAPLVSGPSLIKLTFNADPEERSAYLLKAAEAAAETARGIDFPEASISRSVRWGFPAQEIVAEASEGDFDLVVLAMKPRSTLRRMVLGDTALEVLKGTHTSVLLARPLPVEPGPILVLCQNPAAAGSVVSLLERLLVPGDQRVILAAFIQEPLPPTSLFVSYRELSLWREQAERGVSEEPVAHVALAADGLAGKGYNVEVIVREGDVQQSLRRLADEVNPACLLVSDQPANATRINAMTRVVELGARMPCSVLVARP